jgi:hypothetical protein
LLRVLVFIDRLEGRVVGYGAVGKRNPLGVRDTFLGSLTMDHLSVEKKLLDLVPGWGLFVCGNREELPTQTYDCRNGSKDQFP